MSIPLLQFASTARSHRGNLRSHNEDAFLDAADKALWIVADGMGGHSRGDTASQMLANELANANLDRRLSIALNQLEQQIFVINQALMTMAAEIGPGTTIGSTVVGVLARGHKAVCFWMGDSRVYLYRQRQLHQITRDHSAVEEMVRMGILMPTAAEHHPAANVITRAVGAQSPPLMDLELLDLKAGDRLMLCSDGLYRELDNRELAQHLSNANLEATADNMMQATLGKTAADNLTLVVIDVIHPAYV